MLPDLNEAPENSPHLEPQQAACTLEQPTVSPSSQERLHRTSPSQHQYQIDQSTINSSQAPGLLSADTQTLDVFCPFFDPDLLALFPNGEIPDFSEFETSPLSLDYFELDDWNEASVADFGV